MFKSLTTIGLAILLLCRLIILIWFPTSRAFTLQGYVIVREAAGTDMLVETCLSPTARLRIIIIANLSPLFGKESVPALCI